MIIDTAQVILDLRFWIAETANGLRLTANGLGRLSFFRTSLVRPRTMNDVRIRRTDELER